MNKCIESLFIFFCALPIICLASDNVILVASIRCPHCPEAAQVLSRHHIAFTEVFVENSSLARSLADKSRCHYVPELWVNGKFLGGPDAINDYVRGK